MVEQGINRLGLRTDVTAIRIENGRARGVDTAVGKFYCGRQCYFQWRRAPTPISILLPSNLRRQPIRRPDKLTKYSMGLFVLYFGSRKNLPRRRPSHDLAGSEAQRIIKGYFLISMSSPEDFSLYLHRPTATDASFAPEGCEEFSTRFCPCLELAVEYRLVR